MGRTIKYNVNFIYKFRKKRLDLKLEVNRSKDMHRMRMLAVGVHPYVMNAAVKQD